MSISILPHRARLLVLGIVLCAGAGPLPAAIAAAPGLLEECDVVWTNVARGAVDSMPVGNGDVGLNAWVEKSGDLVFLIGKNDAWSDDLTSPGYGVYGLIKVGRVRVSLSPNPLAGAPDFRQHLALREGAMIVSGGGAQVRLWVDANRPVIRIEVTSSVPVRVAASLESWRKTSTEYLGADTIVSGRSDRVVWYYRNRNREVPELIGRTIGAAIAGEGCAARDPETLVSTQPASTHRLSVHTLTAQTATPEAWTDQLDRQMAATEAVSLAVARREHAAWWAGFWDRSWIFVRGPDRAHEVTTGYILQRFKQACSSRGQYPIKFNGSIFNVEDPTPILCNDKKPGEPNVKRQVSMPVTADFRSWGYQYWFQNTRHAYWPMLASGDHDLMQPLFRMYGAMLGANAKQVREFYGHDGVYFRETAPAWGGLNPITPETPGYYTTHYYTPVLELSAMMLDYFAFTGDRDFVRRSLLPMADGGVTFYDRHFKRDAHGQLLIEPANAIETFWKVRNPTPDLAGLRRVLQGLLELPDDLTDPAARARWKSLLAAVPAVPVGATNGVRRILHFEPGQKSGRRNSENPDLYAVHPFRLYGLGRPDVDVAKSTFAMRDVKRAGCWYQDAVQAALVGDVATAKKGVITHLTNRDRRCRFPAFWAKGHDYAPDEDNGGNGMAALQFMLMQDAGDKILLLPAWPREWDADFKLHAPKQTTVEGRVRGGKLENLVVRPESRRADIVLPGDVP